MVTKKRTTKKKVAKKKAVRSKSTALATRNTTALATMEDFEKQMAAQAEADSARVGAGSDGAYMSIKGGTFTYQDADLGSELSIIILGFVNEKAYYDHPYDSDQPTAPACFAIGEGSPDDLTPFNGVAKLQCETTCADCWANEWASADTGRGKACKDSRKIMFISIDDTEADIENIEVVKLRIPPASLKFFDKFIKGIGKVSKRPCYGVFTDMTVDLDEDYPSVHFKAEGLINDAALLNKIVMLKEMHTDGLMETYDPDDYAEPVKKARVTKKRATKKTPAKKKSKFSR